MAIRKATTTSDFVEESKAEEAPVEAPKETETVTDEVAVSASEPEPEQGPEPEPERAPAPKGYTALIGPAGSVTVVPDSILQALLDSGYTKK